MAHLAMALPVRPLARPPYEATACSFWFSAATLAATSGGASAYPWNFSRWVPRPWVIECRVVEYLYSSASGTIARTLVSRPSCSVPRIWPRRELRSPMTSPSKSSGAQAVTSISGSSSTGRAFGATFRNARMPAILNDISLESTSWYDPSKHSTWKSTIG